MPEPVSFPIIHAASKEYSGTVIEPHKAEEYARHLARQKLAEADELLRCVDPRWKSPPFDPILVAQALGIRCVKVDNPKLDDAMIIMENDQPVILYRCHRTLGRTNFNIFHEIAHTLFPDHSKNHLYWQTRRPRLFEPDGQLEHLCNIAALEFLIPLDLLRRDLGSKSFAAAQVDSLCQRYGASVETVCHRIVEADTVPCALALFENQRQPKHRHSQQKKNRSLSTAATRSQKDICFTYTTASAPFQHHGLFIPTSLSLGSKNCIHRAARSKKLTTGEEDIDLGKDRRQRFYIEALPLTARRRQNGHTPVMAFFYPS